MDKKPTPQTRDNASTKISDSNYGSLITESSSSCLSLLSESDLFDDPSTSGCSSEMASMMQSREKKREKVKEFLRELKAMVPHQPSGSKLGTLSTLDYVVSSMRKITEDQRMEKTQVFKAPSSEPVVLPSLQCPESVDFRNVNDGITLNTQSELTVAVSLKNHVVLHTSTALMDFLGYPHVWWKGRLLKDFVHKRDIMTVNSYISSENAETEAPSTAESRGQCKKKDGSKQKKQFFYARIRRFRNLSSGFSLTSAGSYVFFKIMVTPKPPDSAASEQATEEQKTSKRCMMLYFAPMVSPYKDGQLPPETDQRTFSLRHSLFCTYTYTHANAVALLGFLPQDIVGTSIFDYYHHDDLPQLLDIYKKAMHSMGQPFKSGPLRIRTRNGSYLKVITEWSMFMNPWDHKLEFIIAQHTVVKPPDNPNVFEEDPKASLELKMEKNEASHKLIEKIQDTLQKPITHESAPMTPSDSGGGGSPQNTGGTTPTRDAEKGKEKAKPGPCEGAASSSDISSSIMDEKSISSLYNQVNYSLNIKKFLLSHPKAFPVSDEDSSTDLKDQKEDSEEDMNEEEEMQVEIPVVRPPSCGSSTQVHVSEQGFHEEVPSPPSFNGEDGSLTREAIDNQLMLTQDSLRKHTKAQELLYLQEASKEQPHLFHLKSRRPVGQRGRQKRTRPTGYEDTTDVFKFAKTAKGQHRDGNSGGPGLYMSNFPMTAVDVKPTPTQPTTTGLTTQTPNVVGMMSGPFQTGMGVMPQLTMLPIDPTTGMHLQPFLPTPTSNIQWPYYPQSGYSLLPQVMAGFYQPMLQPLPITQAPPFPEATPGEEPPAKPLPGTQQPTPPNAKGQQKSTTDSDNHLSSAEDTSSSIQYLLDAVSGNNSSPNEETEKMLQKSRRPQAGKLPRRRQVVPPWLQTVNWTPEVRLMYKMPLQKVKAVLKKDRETLKKTLQPEQVKAHLETLLDEVDSPDFMPLIDEEADYLFFPDMRCGDGAHTSSETEGEKTPREDQSLVTFDMGPAVLEEAVASALMSEQAADEEEKAGVASKGVSDSQDGGEGRDLMEVVMTDVPEPMLVGGGGEEEQEAGESLALGKGEEGSAEGDAASAPSPTPMAAGGEALESPSPKVTKLLKDGCSSDDVGSDAGSDKGSENSNNSSRQKNEDAQSSSSKVSSNLTPSEERSTEDAGSSMKESEMSTPKGSFASSSNDKMSTDSGAESTSASTPRPDVLKKLFAPLRVRMSHGRSINQAKPLLAEPFWKQEVDMCPSLAMRYNYRPPDMQTVLEADRRRLANMPQPLQVSCQLLELLQEMEGGAHGKGGATLPAPASSSACMGSRVVGPDTSHPSLPPTALRHIHTSSTGRSDCLEDGGVRFGSGSRPERPDGAGAAEPLSESSLMQPPLRKQSKPQEGAFKKARCKGGAGESTHSGKVHFSADMRVKSEPAPASVRTQLMDKLQSLTPSQHSDDWPGDVIMSKVFLPVDLVSSQAATESSGRSQDTQILDSVD